MHGISTGSLVLATAIFSYKICAHVRSSEGCGRDEASRRELHVATPTRTNTTMYVVIVGALSPSIRPAMEVTRNVSEFVMGNCQTVQSGRQWNRKSITRIHFYECRYA